MTKERRTSKIHHLKSIMTTMILYRMRGQPSGSHCCPATLSGTRPLFKRTPWTPERGRERQPPVHCPYFARLTLLRELLCREYGPPFNSIWCNIGITALWNKTTNNLELEFGPYCILCKIDFIKYSSHFLLLVSCHQTYLMWKIARRATWGLEHKTRCQH